MSHSQNSPSTPPADSPRARLEHNLAQVRARIAAAALAAGRDPAEVELLAVTKSAPADLTQWVFELGVQDLGENRLPGFDSKLAHFEAAGLTGELGPRWHYIGHIQRNKARRVVERSDEIHSVDSLRLLDALLRHAGELERAPGLYLQVKLADEETKGGLDPGEFEAAAERATAAGAQVRGLMAMAPLLRDPEQRLRAADETFARAAELASSSRVQFATPDGRPRLSMGMTGDLELAVAHGSTCLRIGSALFEGLLPDRTPPGTPSVSHG